MPADPLGDLPPFRARGVTAAAIFHIGRCGSTVLTEMLGRQPGIIADSEIYTPVTERLKSDPDFDAVAYTLDRFARQARRAGPAYSFEVKFLSTLDMRFFAGGIAGYLDLLSAQGVEKAILLRRRNLLRRVASTAIAVKRGSYQHEGADSVEIPQVTLRLKGPHLGFAGTLVQLFDFIDAEYAALEEAARTRGFDLLDITYEEDIEADPGIAVSRATRFLGQEPVAVEPRFQRINRQKLSEVILNWEKVCEALAGSRHEWMLTAEEPAQPPAG